MSNFYKRALTGIVIVIVIISGVLSGAYGFLFLCMLIAISGLLEFYRLFKINKNITQIILSVLLSIALFLTTFNLTMHRVDTKVLLINLVLISFIFFTTLFFKIDKPFSNLALLFLGHVYVILPFIIFYQCAFVLHTAVYNSNIILGYIFLLWANDTGAYFFGNLLGKHFLAPSISPNKTIEGCAGGTFLVIVVVFINYHLFIDLSFINWFVIGVLVIITGTLGDLTKSVMKRSLNIKDSGNILPGHGGILDRFDSLIGSVTFVYIYLSIITGFSTKPIL